MMPEPEYITLHNLVFIESARIGYASSEKEASDLARSNAGGGAVYDRRDSAAYEDYPADRPTLDTRGEAQGRRGWRAIPCQAGGVGSLPTRALEVHRRYTSCIPAYGHKNSVSSQVWRPQGTDAATETSWHKYTSLRRRQQHLWTDRPSETPGLPSWAAGSG